MDNQANYFKDPPLLVRDLLKKYLGEKYTYFLESPTELPMDAYPCVIVESATSQNRTGQATGTDDVAEQINVWIVLNSIDNAAASDDYDTTKRQLYQIVQGRDPATGFYLPGTVLFALRTNLSLFNPNTAYPTQIDAQIDINYDVTPRTDQPDLVWAAISIVTRERVVVQNRI